MSCKTYGSPKRKGKPEGVSAPFPGVSVSAGLPFINMFTPSRPGVDSQGKEPVFPAFGVQKVGKMGLSDTPFFQVVDSLRITQQ